MQLVNAIPSNRENNLKHLNTYSQNLIPIYHHLIKSNSLFNIEKLESGELYRIINSSRNNKATLQIYFEKKFYLNEWDWRVIYTLPRKVAKSTYLTSFQYKIQHNIPEYIRMKNFLSLDFLQHHFAPSAILLVKISHIFSMVVQ